MPRINYGKDAEGNRIPGVTTPLNILNKPALVYWGFQQGQLFERGEIGGLYEKRDQAADAGTLAHLMIENHIKGLPEPLTDTLPPEIVDKAEGCFIAYLEWERTHEYKPLESECSLVSKLGYGGTIDISAVLGEPAIVDIKTSKDVYFSMKVQVAAYKALWNENHPDQIITGCHLLQLSPDGGFAHHYYPNLDPEYQAFLHCFEIWKILKATGQRL
jgi:hypothetical protein